jgi:hypothetical protein
MKRTVHVVFLPAPSPPLLWWAAVLCGALGSCWVRVALGAGLAM